MTWSSGFAEVQPQRIELRDVGGEGVALAGIIGLDDVVQLAELHLRVLHVVGAEIVGEVELRGGSALHADLAVVEFQRRVDLAGRRQHEASAVIIGDGREIQRVGGLARHAPRRVAREDIDFPALQLLEALVGVERNELDLLRIVEDRRRHRAAEIDVEAGPVALVVGDREAGQAGVDAAQHVAAPDRPLQGLGVVTLIGDGNSRDCNCDRHSNQEAASECTKHFSLANVRETGTAVK